MEEIVYFGLSPRGRGVHCGGDTWQQAAGMAGLQKWKAKRYIFSYMLKAESKLQVEQGYKHSKLTLSDILPPATLCLLKVLPPPQTVSPSGEQVFIYLSLGRHFSFIPLQ